MKIILKKKDGVIQPSPPQIKMQKVEHRRILWMLFVRTLCRPSIATPRQSKTMTYSSVTQKVNWASTESSGRWAVCATLSQCSTNTDSMILYILHWMIIVIFFSLKILSQQIIFSLFVYYKMPKYKYVDNNRNNVIRYICLLFSNTTTCGICFFLGAKLIFELVWYSLGLSLSYGYDQG